MKSSAKTQTKRIRTGRGKVVFANGVFDIVHKGHLDLLKFARTLGEKLVVALNSDRSTKILKGEGRPINNETDRKTFLEGLGFIDEIVIFDEPTPSEIIRKIKPDIVVKGGEWPAEELRARDKIPAHIEIALAPLTFDPKSANKKYSTTDIINKIKRAEK